ncbi:hypothetical protein BJ742DRAFT_737609 [Cladochytrium replicatum]|nr:hypothetical protein BJ742DRAFT_737609 [Cladochytrium replicatum]
MKFGAPDTSSSETPEPPKNSAQISKRQSIVSPFDYMANNKRRKSTPETDKLLLARKRHQQKKVFQKIGDAEKRLEIIDVEDVSKATSQNSAIKELVSSIIAINQSEKKELTSASPKGLPFKQPQSSSGDMIEKIFETVAPVTSKDQSKSQKERNPALSTYFSTSSGVTKAFDNVRMQNSPLTNAIGTLVSPVTLKQPLAVISSSKMASKEVLASRSQTANGSVIKSVNIANYQRNPGNSLEEKSCKAVLQVDRSIYFDPERSIVTGLSSHGDSPKHTLESDDDRILTGQTPRNFKEHVGSFPTLRLRAYYRKGDKNESLDEEFGLTLKAHHNIEIQNNGERLAYIKDIDVLENTMMEHCLCLADVPSSEFEYFLTRLKSTQLGVLIKNSSPMCIGPGVSEDDLNRFKKVQRLFRDAIKKIEKTTVVSSIPKHQRKEKRGKHTYYYPASRGKGSITFTDEDLVRLQPSQFLNDTIIEFYIRRFHKEYLFFPINERYHWYLVLIYQPGMLLSALEDLPSSKKLGKSTWEIADNNNTNMDVDELLSGSDSAVSHEHEDQDGSKFARDSTTDDLQLIGDDEPSFINSEPQTQPPSPGDLPLIDTSKEHINEIENHTAQLHNVNVLDSDDELQQSLLPKSGQSKELCLKQSLQSLDNPDLRSSDSQNFYSKPAVKWKYGKKSSEHVQSYLDIHTSKMKKKTEKDVTVEAKGQDLSSKQVSNDSNLANILMQMFRFLVQEAERKLKKKVARKAVVCNAKYIETFVRNPDKYIDLLINRTGTPDDWFTQSSVNEKREELLRLMKSKKNEYLQQLGHEQ